MKCTHGERCRVAGGCSNRHGSSQKLRKRIPPLAGALFSDFIFFMIPCIGRFSSKQTRTALTTRAAQMTTVVSFDVDGYECRIRLMIESTAYRAIVRSFELACEEISSRGKWQSSS